MKHSIINKLLIFCSLVFCAAAALILCNCARLVNEEGDPEYCTVSYVDGFANYAIDSIPYGGYAENYIIPNKDGYVFAGWKNGSELFDFSTEITYDVKLTAEWKEDKYNIKFVADGFIVKTETCSTKTFESIIPSVPEKEYFTGEWEAVTLGDNHDVTVNAIYTPVEYTATFYDINLNVYDTVKYTVTQSPQLPEPPQQDGLIAEWLGLPLSGGDCDILVRYTFIKYKINFVVNGNVIQTQDEYTIISPISYPEIPDLQHYNGSWSAPAPAADEENVLTISAVYTPVTYYITFQADGEEVSRVPYDKENTDVDEPPVPDKEHYTGSWNSYVFIWQNQTVEARYTPIDYTVTFIADGDVIGVETFNIEKMYVTPPACPQKHGYNGAWQSYKLELKNTVIYAEYTFAFEDAYKYTLSKDKTYYTVKGYTGTETDIIVPAYHDGLPVKNIGENFLLGNTTVTRIEIQPGIEIIEACAFQVCTALQTIEIPSTVKAIGDYAFSNCCFTEIVLPECLESLGEYCLSNGKLESITIPKNITYIGPYCFSRCENLKEARFNNCETEISEGMFAECTSLQTVSFGTGISGIRSNAFRNCSSLTQITIPASITLIEKSVFSSAAVVSVTFEDLSGWNIASAPDGTVITSVEANEINDAYDAAYRLVHSYSGYCWIKA